MTAPNPENIALPAHQARAHGPPARRPRRPMASATCTPMPSTGQRTESTGDARRHGACGSRRRAVASTTTITNRLLDGALGGLAVARRRPRPTSPWPGCPGAFELPLAAKAFAESGAVDAVICLGAVIRGDTAALRVRGGGVRRGHPAGAARHRRAGRVRRAHHREPRPGARPRSDADGDNKGEEAARTALEMVDLLRRLPAPTEQRRAPDG